MGEVIKGIVRSVTDPKEWIGKMQIGFTLEAESKKWYNVDGEEEVLIELKEAVVSKGNEIEFEFEKGKVGNITLISKAKPKESEDYNDETVGLEELLTAGHKKGIKSMKSEMISIDLINKIAVFKVTIIGNDNSSFEAYGDATAENLNKMIAPHYIRMAESRALGRSLRFFTNNAKVSDVELPSGEKKKK